MMRNRRAIQLIAATSLAVGTGACSLLFAPNEDQCSSDTDCTARGAAFASTRCSADNVCIASVGPGVDSSTGDAGVDANDPFACAKIPAPAPDPSKPVDVSIRYTDFSTGMPPENTLVRLCANTDSMCMNARTSLQGAGPGDAGPEGGVGWVQTRPDGTVNSKVELGFEGFFEVRAPQYPPSFRNVSPALRNPTNDFDSLLLRPAELKFLADEALGKQNAYDTVGHGIVFVFAKDCFEQPIGGASFTTTATDPILTPFYVINSAPSITDTKSDSLGRGGFINVPPGIHTFSAFMGEGDQKKRIGSSRALIRVGATTTVVVEPSP
jgi:hypothetical protein